MPLFVPMGRANGVNTQEAGPGSLIAGGESISAGAITTAGDGTWLGANIATGIIRRSGPAAGYTDTTDTSTNILAALAGNANATECQPGVTFRLLFQNTVAQAMTLAAGVGVALGTGVTTTAASLGREYLFTILNASTALLMNCVTTNGSALVTFVLPPGMAAFPIGPLLTATNITPGMVISGTGITAGTKVLGVTQGVGGITGVTMDANATATSAGVALLFVPSIRIDSLRSSTL